MNGDIQQVSRGAWFISNTVLTSGYERIGKWDAELEEID